MHSVDTLKVIDAAPRCRYVAEDEGLPPLEDIFTLEGQDRCISQDVFAYKGGINQRRDEQLMIMILFRL
ncbi:uncharacterized [Tachysurus ichikawai]